VKIGGVAATITQWSSTTIQGAVPRVAVGYSRVAVERVDSGTTTALNIGPFRVTKPTVLCGLYVSAGGVYAQPQYAYLYAEDAVKSYYAVDPSPALLAAGLTPNTTAQFIAFDSATVIMGLTEGAHTVAYGSVDQHGDYDILQSSPVFADATEPTGSMFVNGVAVSSSTSVAIQTSNTITISAQDPQSQGGASGVKTILFLVDTTADSCFNNNTLYTNRSAAPGTCGNPWYNASFTLPTGTHTVEVDIKDNVDNLNWGRLRWTFAVSQ